MISRNSEDNNSASSLFFWWLLLGLVFSSRLGDLFVSQNTSNVASQSRGRIPGCAYTYHVWSNLNFLYNSQWTTLLTELSLVLNSFCDNLLHSLIMRLIVSSVSPHDLHLLFCWVLSILALIWFLLIALFCAAIRSYSVSLYRFLFFNHVQVFSCVKSLVSRLKRPESCFSSHFYLLVIFTLLTLLASVLFLVLKISLPSHLSIESLYRCVNAILNAGKFSDSFSWHI